MGLKKHLKAVVFIWQTNNRKGVGKHDEKSISVFDYGNISVYRICQFWRDGYHKECRGL